MRLSTRDVRPYTVCMSTHRRRPGPEPIGPEIKVRLPAHIVEAMRKRAVSDGDDRMPVAEQIRELVEEGWDRRAEDLRQSSSGR